jgi:hypothetical protein
MNIFTAGDELMSSERQTVTDVTAGNGAVPNITKALQK